MGILERDVGATRLTCVETAKLIRQALKREFSGTKFSVRSHSYAGGASIDVHWTDGPTAKAVDAVIKPFSGADFDGMIDLKIHSSAWLTPDGAVVTARSGGQGSTWPERITSAPSPDARLVSFGADYVFSHRKLSPEREAGIKAEIMAAAGVETFEYNGDYDVAIIDGEAVPCTGQVNYMKYGTTLFNRLAGERSW